MDIITLVGAHKTGKTPTLLDLAEFLKNLKDRNGNHYYDISLERYAVGSRTDKNFILRLRGTKSFIAISTCTLGYDKFVKTYANLKRSLYLSSSLAMPDLATGRGAASWPGNLWIAATEEGLSLKKLDEYEDFQDFNGRLFYEDKNEILYGRDECRYEFLDACPDVNAYDVYRFRRKLKARGFEVGKIT